MLRIGTVQALDEFTLQYGVPSKLWPRSIVYTSVLWSGLAKDYAGIIIAPYLYQRRLDGNANWYYGYDCACGCIWDAGAIAEVRPITLV